MSAVMMATDDTVESQAVSVVRSIGSGLPLIDQFHALALRLLGRHRHEPPTTVEPGQGDTLQIWHGATVVQIVTPTQVDLGAWDSTRYCALSRRVRNNWDVLNGLWAEMPLTSGIERARGDANLSRIKEELCIDLKEMLTMCERTLGTKLPERYSIGEVCEG